MSNKNGNGKIDRVKLSQMLREGKTGKECAAYFGVTKGAISKAKSELRISVVKNVQLETAHKVVEKNLNAVEQLQKINAHANEILDLVMRWVKGEPGAIQVLESAMRKVRVKDKEQDVTEYKLKDPHEIALKAMAEIRGQIGLQLDIFKTLHDAQAVADFQEEVLTIIGEVSTDVRTRIITRLQERRALRSTVTIN